MNSNQKIIFILQKKLFYKILFYYFIKCCFQTGSPSEHNGKAVADLSKSENDGETDLAPEKQKTKGKTKYSIADLLKQVWFLLCLCVMKMNLQSSMKLKLIFIIRQNTFI